MLTIKNIKRCRSSHEGSEAVSLNLYWNAKKVGHAADDGWGGGFVIRLDKAVEDEITLWAKSLPDYQFGNGQTLAMDVEMVILNLLEAHDKAKEEAKNKKKLDNFCKKLKEQYAKKGWGTVRIDYADGVGCVPFNEKNNQEKAVAIFKEKNPNLVVTNWAII